MFRCVVERVDSLLAQADNGAAGMGEFKFDSDVTARRNKKNKITETRETADLLLPYRRRVGPARQATNYG